MITCNVAFGVDVARSVPTNQRRSRMTAENDKSLSSEMLKARNAILIEFGDHSFDQALDEIKSSLATEKDRAKRLALLSAAVNVDEELVEMLEASRQYENNVEMVTTLRGLMMRTISMGK